MVDRVAGLAVQPKDGALSDHVVVEEGDQLAEARKLDGLPRQPDFGVVFAGGRGFRGGCDRLLHDGETVSQGPLGPLVSLDAGVFDAVQAIAVHRAGRHREVMQAGAVFREVDGERGALHELLGGDRPTGRRGHRPAEHVFVDRAGLRDEGPGRFMVVVFVVAGVAAARPSRDVELRQVPLVGECGHVVAELVRRDAHCLAVVVHQRKTLEQSSPCGLFCCLFPFMVTSISSDGIRERRQNMLLDRGLISAVRMSSARSVLESGLRIG